MGRRGRFVANRFENGSRCSVGDYYVDQACTRLNIACAKEAAMFTQEFTARDVIPMLFRDEQVAKLTAVHGLLATEDQTEAYDLAPYVNGSVTLKTDYMPAPDASTLYWQPERAGPLAAAIQTLDELHVKWGAVKHLLRWFNRNATIGAVRANWPSVLTLCPDAPSLKELQHSPTRYTNPQDLPGLLPLIRATATTVASMAMIPGEAMVRPRGTVWIALPERTVTYEGTDIKLDAQTFHL
jgi:hypothetical protein